MSILALLVASASFWQSSRQANFAQGQLAEMAKQSAITEEQLRPKLTMSIETSGKLQSVGGITPDPDSRFVTPTWKNNGPLEPIRIEGWDKIQYFFDGDYAWDSRHLNELSPGEFSFSNVYKTEKMTFSQDSLLISGDQARAILSQKGQLLVWGEISYSDPLPGSVVHRIAYCQSLVLENSPEGKRSAWVPYSKECNHGD